MRTCAAYLFALILAFTILYGAANAQSNAVEDKAQTNAPPVVSNAGAAKAPIRGYRGIELGDSLDSVVSNVYMDPYLELPPTYIEGKPDLPGDAPEYFLRLRENAYYKSGYFLFRNNRLYSIRLAFNQRQFSFIDLVTTLGDKYGQGRYLDANTIVWTNGQKSLILERPAVVKYFDDSVLQAQATNTPGIRANPKEAARKYILNGL